MIVRQGSRGEEEMSERDHGENDADDRVSHVIACWLTGAIFAVLAALMMLGTREYHGASEPNNYFVWATALAVWIIITGHLHSKSERKGKTDAPE